ncbi:MAG TPA: ATP-binding protein [Kineosporiaceae bacterium]|nr:ATP-binding protein [Kineosporiaceae bacterium]
MIPTLLDRQLRRLGLAAETPPNPQEWQRFLDTVSATYDDHDQDRYLLERAMTVSSDEMRTLYDTLNTDRERLRAVIDSLDVGLIVLDAQLRVELANPEASRLLGVSGEEILHWTLEDLLRCGQDDDRVRGLLAGLLATEDGTPSVRAGCHDARLRGADGRIVPVSASVVPVEHLRTVMGAVIVLRDLSDLHRLEVELRAAQKLEAVGRLAAGIAHELNTPIQFIGDNLKFVRDSMSGVLDAVVAVGLTGQPGTANPAPTAVRTEGSDPEDLAYLIGELPEAITQSLEGVDRVTSIVRAMKSFAHPGNVTVAPADINQALRDTVTVARNEVKGLADVELRLGELPAVECLVHDLKQVFLNLVVNAAHAIADRQKTLPGRGRITIASTVDDDHVVIDVTDDGCGMTEDVAEHAFEPFFTTKEVGRGTGQGLALARSIVVEGHHGTITLQSQPMRGATFRIRIPIREN